MRQLLLLRHAKSAWDDPGLGDHVRPLNARGRAVAASLRGVMETIGLRPDLVLVSSARRTLQTLEALQPWPAAPDGSAPVVQPLDALYLASADQLLDTVRAVPPATRSVLVIGHNPGFHEFAMLLGDDPCPATEDQRKLLEGFPTGGLVEFGVASEWAALARGGGQLNRFVDPRDQAA